MQPTTIKVGPVSITYPTLFTVEERDVLSANVISYAAARAGFAPQEPIAAQFRLAMVKLLNLPPGTVLTPQYIGEKYIGLAVFAGILIFLALAFSLLSCVFCSILSPRATKCGHNKAGHYKKPTGFRKLDWKSWRTWLPILACLILLPFLIWGIVCVMRGTLQMNDELAIAVKAVNEILLLVEFKIAAIPQLIKGVAVNVNATVTRAVDVSADLLTSPEVTAQLNRIQLEIQQLAQQVKLPNDPLQNLAGDLNNLAVKVQDATTKLVALIERINGEQTIDGGSVSLKPEFQLPQVDGQRAQRIAELAKDLQTSLNDPNSDLSKALIKTQAVVGVLATGNVSQIWTQGVDRASQEALDYVGGYAQQLVDKSLAMYENSLGKVIASANEVEQQFYNLIQILNYIEIPRNVLTIMLEVAVMLFIIVAMVAIIVKSPSLLANCSMAAMFLVIMSFLLSGIYLIIAAAINETCYYMQEERWEVLLPTINAIANINIQDFQISAIIDARRGCANGVGIVSLAADLLGPEGLAIVTNDTVKEILGITESFNQTLQDKAGEIREKIAASGAKIPAEVQKVAQEAAADVRNVADRIKQIQETKLDPLLTNLATPSDREFPAIKAKAEAILQAGQDALDVSKLPQPVINSAIRQIKKQAEDLLGELDRVQAVVSGEGLPLEQKVTAAVTTLDSELDALTARMYQLADKLDELGQILVNVALASVDKIVDKATPLLVNSTEWVITESGKAIVEIVGCKWIVQDTYIAQNAICVGVARSTDAQWFGLFLQAVSLCFLIPSFMWLAKKVWNVDPAEWSWRGDVEKAAAKAEAGLGEDVEKVDGKMDVSMMDKTLDVNGLEMDKKNPYVTSFPATEPYVPVISGLNGTPVVIQQSTGSEMIMTPSLPAPQPLSPLDMPSPSS